MTKHQKTTAPAREQVLAHAMQAVQAAASRAAQDPGRPVYHFHPPAQWMNDPNAPLYHNGYYHLFYQHNPYGDTWDHMHWGHARSKDLVNWEHLPIALWPSEEHGEAHCYSGCGHINAAGQPMIFYTKVGGGTRDERPPNEQWAALGDDDLITWTKHPQNPILDLNTHGGPTFRGTWRDPFIFEAQGRTFMVLGVELEDMAGVALYESEDPHLAQWTYRGLLYQAPKDVVPFFECPNFFNMGDTWVLLYSPYGPVRYLTGTFDLPTYTFTPEAEGCLDHGPGFYASNVLRDADGRWVILGWVRGWESGHGWNGCLSLPRLLTLDKDGALHQVPHPALESLRTRHVQMDRLILDGTTQYIPTLPTNTLEIHAVLEPYGARAMGLRLGREPMFYHGALSIHLDTDQNTLKVASVEFPHTLREKTTSSNPKLDLHIFYDHTLLEVFIDERRVCTQTVSPAKENPTLKVFAEGGRTRVHTLELWYMKPATFEEGF